MGKKKQPNNFNVYIHTVPKEISGYEYDKYYIGITSQKPEHRWTQGTGYKGQVFENAIRKYGWDNIRHEVVATNLSKEEAIDMERLLIFTYNSQNSKYGYNATIGGDGGFGMTMTDATKEKLTEITKNLWQDEEYKNNVLSNLPRGRDHHRSVKVALLNTGEVFECETDAERKYGVSEASMIRYFRGEETCEKKDANGKNLVFRRYEDYIKMSEQEIQELIEHDTKYNNRRKAIEPIVCLNTGEIFDYSFEAIEKYHLYADHSYYCLNGKMASCGNYNGEKLVWKYKSQYEEFTKQGIDELISRANTSGKGSMLIDLKTKNIYHSATHCSKHTGIHRNMIRKVILHKEAECCSHKGRFVDFDEYIKNSGQDKETVLKEFSIVK